MIQIVGTVRIPAGSIDAARPAMERMLAASRAEPGCLRYSYAVDVLDEGLVHVVEAWADRDALAAIRNRKIGFVFQQFHLLPRTNAVENVEIPLVYSNASDPEQRAIAALTQVGLGERLK